MFDSVACYVYGIQQNGAQAFYEVHRPDIGDTYYGTADQVLGAQTDFGFSQPNALNAAIERVPRLTLTERQNCMEHLVQMQAERE